jgi:hypothetical protein
VQFSHYIRKPEERDHLKNLSVDGRIIFKWILTKWSERVWNGSIWFRIETIGRFM